MIKIIKKMAVEKGKALLQSEAVSKILASEKMGTVIEKAMTVPFKISTAVAHQKEKLVEMFDLATQEDMDELRRTVSRMEEELSSLKNCTEKTEHH
jgi:polyhydroxyalkanoate synthesis regulator phasin